LNAMGDSVTHDAAMARARQALAGYGVFDVRDWKERSEFRRLDPDRRRQLEEDIGELLLLLAQSEWRRTGSGPGREETAREGLRLNRLAEVAFAGAAPRTLWEQRAELARAANDSFAVEESDHRAALAAPSTARELFLEASAHFTTGRFQSASECLEKVVAREPSHAAAEFALAYCHDMLGAYQPALERYDIARALQPDNPRPSFNRGLIYLYTKQYERAEREFTQALVLEPTHADSYKNRGLARLRLGRNQGAVEDFTQALELDGPALQILPLRAQAFEALGKKAEAAHDRDDARQREPRREGDFLVRASTRLASDPNGALADLRHAEELNRRSLPALRNQAHILAEHLHRTDDALGVLERLIALYPDFAPAHAERAVLLARLGRRREAQTEAGALRASKQEPILYYQLAGVYALTMKQHPEDRTEALALLRKAFQEGFRDIGYIEQDPDLANFRDDKEFAELIRVARALFVAPPK
jgi:eukaryotic-like serine/threonine-protein kinase